MSDPVSPKSRGVAFDVVVRLGAVYPGTDEDARAQVLKAVRSKLERLVREDQDLDDRGLVTAQIEELWQLGGGRLKKVDHEP